MFYTVTGCDIFIYLSHLLDCSFVEFLTTPNNVDALLKNVLQKQRLISHFVEEAIRLYGEEVANFKFHAILHITDDYRKFGPAHLWSAFRFENFLGKLKKMVRSHHHPDVQIVNMYSDLLHTGHFTDEHGDKGSNEVLDYYEKPLLTHPDRRMTFQACGGSQYDHMQYSSDCYLRLYVRNFHINVVSKANSICVLHNGTFVRVRHIMTNEKQNAIFLCGNMFHVHGSLFSFTDVPPHRTSENADDIFKSENVRLVTGTLTQERITFEYSEISQKACAIPLLDQDDTDGNNFELYALIRFLH